MAASNTDLACLTSLEWIAFNHEGGDGLALEELRDAGLLVLDESGWALTPRGERMLRNLRSILPST